MSPQKKNVFIGIFSILLIIGLYMFFDNSKKDQVVANINTSSDPLATTTVNLGGGIVATIPGGYEVESVGDDSITKSAPSLTRQVVFSVNLDPNVKTTIQKKVSELQTELKKDVKKFDYWVDLGIYHKVAGDYVGAKIYWDYAGKLSPTNFISFGNLGNMYAYQLKDMVNAEKYYNQAIKNGPTQIYLYFQLAEAYRDVSKNMTKARATVDLGLKANPNNPELLALKDSLN
ncbi:MAG: tetratricopeptide repeat protein [Minisyncoccota bacterium]